MSSFTHDHNTPNGFFQIKNISFVRINSMALHPDAVKTPGGRQQRDEIDAMLATGQHVDVVLTHQPLYRMDDLHCGVERQQDPIGGGVTFFPSKQKLLPDDDVVNQAYTNKILKQWTPRTVLSGHLHSVCRYQHTTEVQELTVPTFSWRMRPDAKYFLISFEEDGTMKARQCSLPNEHYFMVLTTVWIIAIILVGAKLACFRNSNEVVAVAAVNKNM